MRLSIQRLGPLRSEDGTMKPVLARLMTADEAAAYLRLPKKAFERLCIARVIMGTSIRYDRVALDAHLDALSGLAARSAAPAANDDPEAAFERSAPDLRHAPGRP